MKKSIQYKYRFDICTTGNSSLSADAWFCILSSDTYFIKQNTQLVYVLLKRGIIIKQQKVGVHSAESQLFTRREQSSFLVQTISRLEILLPRLSKSQLRSSGRIFFQCLYYNKRFVIFVVKFSRYTREYVFFLISTKSYNILYKQYLHFVIAAVITKRRSGNMNRVYVTSVI